MINYQANGLCSNCCAGVDTEKMSFCPACGYCLDVHWLSQWGLVRGVDGDSQDTDYFTIEEAQNAEMET